MGNTIGRFTFKVLAPRKGEMPFNAIVEIGPKRWSTDENGSISLTPYLKTEEEIDSQISAFKADLDKVGRDAKRALRRANERTLADVSARR